MVQKGEWIPPSAPLSEGYWQALLRNGENGRAAPSTSPARFWNQRKSDTEGVVEQSAETISVDSRWETAKDLMRREEILELPVVGCNRGGVLVDWNGLRGFVPASHLLGLTPLMDENQRQEKLQHLIGTRLPLKIIEVNPDSNRFVLSERATQPDEEQREQMLTSLEPGDVCQGRVTNLCSFGAFVDLGGFEGLIHISELSWGRVGHPSDVLNAGQPVDVYVLNVEPERERVGLSIKRLLPNPWQSVESRYSVGQTVEGSITQVVDFGAFVQVEEGLEGLIHVSELGSGDPRHPQDVLQEGDVVSVQVLSIDQARRRMGLRLKHIEPSERASEPSQHRKDEKALGA